MPALRHGRGRVEVHASDGGGDVRPGASDGVEVVSAAAESDPLSVGVLVGPRRNGAVGMRHGVDAHLEVGERVSRVGIGAMLRDKQLRAEAAEECGDEGVDGVEPGGIGRRAG